jgi:hypothetical protein
VFSSIPEFSSDPPCILFSPWAFIGWSGFRMSLLAH